MDFHSTPIFFRYGVAHCGMTVGRRVQETFFRSLDSSLILLLIVKWAVMVEGKRPSVFLACHSIAAENRYKPRVGSDERI